MQSSIFHYVLLAGLAIALLFAAYTDWRWRKIANWLTAAIALGAPLFWLTSGLELWPGIAIQIGMALAAFAALAGLFAMRMMGGGDVKLLAALALWIAPSDYLTMLIVMAIAGGVLTLFIGVWNVIQRQPGKLSVPYGIAIAIAALWILGVNYVPTAPAWAGSLG